MAAEQWRLHPSFDGNIERIIDTPDYTYFLSLSQLYSPGQGDHGQKYKSLFRYDKGSDEMIGLNSQNLLTENVVQIAEYNPEKKYLMAVYDNGNIDLVYDNGDVVNIPGFMFAEDFEKTANTISFYPAANEAYIATDFGFVVIDDSKGEIDRSSNFRSPVNTAARLGDKIFVGKDDGLYVADFSKHLLPEDLRKVDGTQYVKSLTKFQDRLYMLQGENRDGGLAYVELRNNEPVVSPWALGTIVDVEFGKDALVVSAPEIILCIDSKYDVIQYNRRPEDNYKHIAGWKPGEFWMDNGRDGIQQLRASKDDSGAANWTVTKDNFRPNAATVFKATDMVYHPEYGMLVRNRGISPVFSYYDVQAVDLLCSYKNGEWTPLSPAYYGLTLASRQWNPAGIAVDPNNRDYVYSGSVFNGLMRLNLSDSSDFLRMGRQGDPANGQQGFFGIRPDFQSWSDFCLFSAPVFDTYGNMWMGSFDRDKSAAKVNSLELWYWTPSDRALTKDANSVVIPKCLNIESSEVSPTMRVTPLRSSASRNILIYSSGNWGGGLLLIDHKGTIENQGDDEITSIKTFVDQDGVAVPYSYINMLLEDTSTGRVWAGTDVGVFHFMPADIIKTGGRVTRIKVARNDGTNLADYLLDGVSVNSITVDNTGRKWFGTAGGGIVITSSDGTDVLKSYTTDNSELPDNAIYGICYNPENNSMMVSTDKGLAELFLTTSAVGSGSSQIKAYPNPVRPDYYGYVTIEGLADNALVKIVDASGNLIKELGFAAGGEITWNVTNLNNKRVPGGVYYILASGAPDSDNFSAAAKILVVN